MDDDRRLNSVAEALAHVEAPDESVAWAQPFGHDFPEAWRRCPNPCWLIDLAHTARMPFESILAAITAASRYFLDVFPRDADIEGYLELGIPLETVASDGVADISALHELTRSDAFKHEDRYYLGYGDGFVEQAYCMAVGSMGELEVALIASCGHSPARARERMLAIFHEQVSVEAFLTAYTRCVRLGFAGLELNR